MAKEQRVVGIEKDGVKGTITFDNVENKKVNFSLDFGDDGVKSEVENYLTTEQEFWIPESDRIDDYRVDKEKPTKSPMYFSLALCTLHSKHGVWVNW